MKGERKLVTIMFADISGFTGLAETMDPEAVRDLMNACFERLVPVIEKYEGTVDADRSGRTLSATRSWRSLARRWPTRTTPNGPCARHWR